MEKRVLAQNKDITFDKGLATSTESVLKDQFPLRDFSTKAYYQLKYWMTKPFGSVWNNGFLLTYIEESVIQTDDDHLIRAPFENTEEDLESARSRGYNVSEFDQKYPDVKTYVYFPTHIEELLNETWTPLCRNAFISQLNDTISYSALEMNGKEDFERLEFKSDSHWTIDGAYQGYQDIISMMNHDFDIGEPKTIKNEITFDYVFRGNTASQIGQIGPYDHIRDYELNNIGEYDYYVNKELADINEPKIKYTNEGNHTVYSDYDLYFGDNYFLRTFDFHDESKPNILIFADSNINCIKEWVASHFNQTVIIDLRAKPADFNLDDYIQEYDIDIALVCLSADDLFFNGLMYIPV